MEILTGRIHGWTATVLIVLDAKLCFGQFGAGKQRQGS